MKLALAGFKNKKGASNDVSVEDPREEGFLVKGGCWEAISRHRRGTLESLLFLLFLSKVSSEFRFSRLTDTETFITYRRIGGRCLASENMCRGGRTN